MTPQDEGLCYMRAWGHIGTPRIALALWLRGSEIAFSMDLPSYGGHLSAGVTLILITHILFIPVETEAQSMSQIIIIFSSLPLQVWGNGGQPWEHPEPGQVCLLPARKLLVILPGV